MTPSPDELARKMRWAWDERFNEIVHAHGTNWELLSQIAATTALDSMRGKCETCGGSGVVERTIGGDGYGDRCAAQADVEAPCPDCATPEGRKGKS